MKKLMTFGIVGVVLVAASVAFAQPGRPAFGRGGHGGRCGPGMGPGGGPGMGVMGLGHCLRSPELGLSAEQRVKLELIREKGMERMKAERPRMMELRKGLVAAFADPKVDAAALKTKVAEVRKAMQDAMDQGTDLLIEARAVLTPEQLKKIPDLKGCGKFEGPDGGPDGDDPREGPGDR